MGFQDWGWGGVSGTAGKFPPNFREWQEGVTKKLKMKILFIFFARCFQSTCAGYTVPTLGYYNEADTSHKLQKLSFS